MTEAARNASIEAGSSLPGFEDARRALRVLDGAVWVDPALRALVQARTAQIECAAAQLAEHAREAIELGERPVRLVHLGNWRDSLLFDQRERAALTLADAFAGPTDGAALRRAARHLDPHELVQLALACAATAAHSRMERIERSQT